MKVSSQPHIGTHVFNARARTGMAVVDRERENEWLEQMDTILTFVCLALFAFRSN